MHKPASLAISAFGPGDQLAALPQTQQVQYVRGYLADLGATSILEEPQYFDRDYLSEFAAFYGVSATGYSNICRRLHFFSGPVLTRSRLVDAAGSGPELQNLQTQYLGFVVLRPIPQAPLGRTVLRWYADPTPTTPRVTNSSRKYRCNVAGIILEVEGLAWQQQDTGVGACATVGLWTMLHSSAFDDNHAIPTTVEITRAAHETASLGARVFPSTGLSIYQVGEAIKAWDLSPLAVEGDLTNAGREGFSKPRFAATCAAFIRSGYPILLLGTLNNPPAQPSFHITCAVGFRATPPAAIANDATEIEDSWINHLYIHDDNIGPNVRFQLGVGTNGEAILSLSGPAASSARTALNFPPLTYPTCTPHRLIVAVHNDLRTSADTLHRTALRIGTNVCAAANTLRNAAGQPLQGVIVGARFNRLSKYLNEELNATLLTPPALLAKVRLDLAEKVRPMSLHIGVVRIGDSKSNPLMDIFYDTTDSESNHPVFANVAYSALGRAVEKLVTHLSKLDLGEPIDAF